jgi:uncharacterized membrane protein YwzB
MSLIAVLVALIILALVYWAILRILAAFGVGEPIATVVQVAFVIIVVLYLVSAFFGASPMMRIR